MKKKKPKIKCHCCRQMVSEKSMKKVAGLFPFDGAHGVVGKSDAEAILIFQDLYEWACDDCIETGQALLANPRKQFFKFKYPWDTAFPYLAYRDREFTCRDCGEAFVFSKTEQQFWYEKMQFVVHSKPVRCLACRKRKRHSRALNTELSNLLKNGKPEDRTALLRIAEIYAEMGKPEKEKAYRKAARDSDGSPS